MSLVKKLAVLIVYFGKFPKYMPYFLQSASYNSDLEFIIFTDAQYSNYTKYNNIKFVDMNLAAFSKLASKKMNLPVVIRDSYKLCDFKPMYGFILSEYISSYSHWAHCDVDMVFGDISGYLSRKSLYDYDVVSSHGRYISGAFTMYKNIDTVNTAFMLSKDYKKVLTEDKYLSFDEASTVISKLWNGHNIFDFESEIESISHVVKNFKNNIKSYFADFIVEKIQGKVVWREGCLYHRNKEIVIFHYLIYKGKISFNTPSFKANSRYVFTDNGFFLNNLGSYTYIWLSSIFSNFSGKVKSKIRRKLKSFK